MQYIDAVYTFHFNKKLVNKGTHIVFIRSGPRSKRIFGEDLEKYTFKRYKK